ncbi:14-3-3 protein [Polyporus arcularius HHB13444]|uniref:14-3-3 protein n=1 Tax=Polyporus arcularius HHB13444 TaxID=1314778 RepID=A0A5C3PVV5_9APHY|nr:14-3-3 protein [Polyporus arcularius HHB13444]
MNGKLKLNGIPSTPSVFDSLPPIGLGELRQMDISLSRLDCLFLAKIADQAERYHDVVAQLKDIISDNNAQLTIDERNLLSIAYKNLTANLRASWRTIDALQKKEALSSTRQQVKLMRVQKDLIEKDLDKVCRDIVDLLEKYLIPAASDGEEKVFYAKMRGDYYRYLAELTRLNSREELGKRSLEAYKSAYRHALATLPPTHPTRLGLALNFAVYFHDIMRSPERACHLAKHAFDEAVMAASADSNATFANLEDALMILQLMRDDLILWHGEISKVRFAD